MTFLELLKSIETAKAASTAIAPTVAEIEADNYFEDDNSELVPQLKAISKTGIQLNEQQLNAIDLFTRRQFGLLIGYAGTGKTTTVKELIKQLMPTLSTTHSGPPHLHFPIDRRPYSFAMCAFTGMAVKQMRRSVSEVDHGNDDYYPLEQHCYTIHKLLGYSPVEEWIMDSDGVERLRMVMRPTYGKYNKLRLGLVIIDEVSMLACELMQELIEALEPDCKIIAIGDIAQLPPVFGRPVMPLMLKHWPIAELTTIYRQKDGSLIDNANKIRNQVMPITNDSFKILGLDKDSKKAQNQIVLQIKSLLSSSSYDPKQDIILTTNNNGDLGQEKLNILARPLANPNGKIVQIKTMRNMCYLAVGDRVMCTKNDATLGIYNGQLGWVTAISVQKGHYSDHEKSKAALHGEIDEEHLDDMQSGFFDDVEKLVSAANDKQIAAKNLAKLNSVFGTSIASNVVDRQAEAEVHGTAQRGASHTVLVRFDNADGTDELVSLSSSNQIENLIPAWIITVHKSQGSGFRNVFIIAHDVGGALLRNELLYTAVTRCISKVTIMTTQFAFNKCIYNQTIKGTTLDEKLRNYMLQFADIPEDKRFKLPEEKY
jgi:ATP-dependent exoDNAse (exonuclease V) alpha subunit